MDARTARFRDGGRVATVREEKVRTLPQYLELLEQAQRRAPSSLWYRGCGTASYKLLPSLYRHERLKTPEELADLERSLMTRFRQRSIPYHRSEEHTSELQS